MPWHESETIYNARPKIYNATGYMSPIAIVKNGQRYTSTSNGEILEPTNTLVTPTAQYCLKVLHLPPIISFLKPWTTSKQ